VRCIFCKRRSDDAKSVEHIIPQSLGNNLSVLPRGMICDTCNNYFARKIEQPLLAHESFRNLRAWYRIPNKKGRYPSLYGVVPGTEIGVRVSVGDDGVLELEPERHSDIDALSEAFRSVEGRDDYTALFFSRDMNPPRKEMSRLLAKVALEVVALRMSHNPEYVERLIDDPHWDRIRRWVRHGDTIADWPYHMRRVYPEETQMTHPDSGEWVQAGYIIDLMLTRRREHFIVLILYGYEFALNVGGPSIKGYEEWLTEHCGKSPLIERMGLKLELDEAVSPPIARLVGEPSLKMGVEFDLAQGVEGLFNGV
jgi:hypothetical protein